MFKGNGIKDYPRRKHDAADSRIEWEHLRVLTAEMCLTTLDLATFFLLLRSNDFVGCYDLVGKSEECQIIAAAREAAFACSVLRHGLGSVW
jgi:hypothetical protein